MSGVLKMSSYFVVVLIYLLTAVTAKEKQISLEDIERENLQPSNNKQTTPTNYGFVPPKTISDYVKPPQYSPQPQPQQYSSQPQQLYYPQQYVQYIQDNHIPQQYYPQYYYLQQQYTAPSTAIQTIVDPKGGIQYVMYVPSYVQKAEQTENYENVVQYVVPQTQYVQQESSYVKQEPKSLLDSYVPSYLQIQYYKQQQAKANAIQQELKQTSAEIVAGKEDYRPAQIQHKEAESIQQYTYQTPGSA